MFPPTAESFGVSAQIGCGVVRGGPEVRFHEDSTRIPPGFHQGSTRVPLGFHKVLRGLRGSAGGLEVRLRKTRRCAVIGGLDWWFAPGPRSGLDCAVGPQSLLYRQSGILSKTGGGL